MDAALERTRTREHRFIRFAAGMILCIALLSACATVGRDFSAAKVFDIRIGETTQAQIRSLFGMPWRVGIEDGDRTWTYAIYRYSAFSETRTKDLVIRFNGQDVVKSYTFNSSDPADTRKMDSTGR
jgi:outer membrane protein assembly factor BamE (lipoprotein component of BamABCDE complex)